MYMYIFFWRRGGGGGGGVLAGAKQAPSLYGQMHAMCLLKVCRFIYFAPVCDQCLDIINCYQNNRKN